MKGIILLTSLTFIIFQQEPKQWPAPDIVKPDSGIMSGSDSLFKLRTDTFKLKVKDYPEIKQKK